MIRQLAALALVVVALSVSGCSTTPWSPKPAATADVSPAVAPPPPVPSSSAPPAAAVGSIPTECSALVAESSYSASFGAWPLNDPAVVGAPGTEFSTAAGAITPSAAPSGAGPAEVLDAASQLRCIWRDPQADVSNLSAELGAVDPAFATTWLGSLPAAGYTCTPHDGGLACEHYQQNTQYPVEDGDVAFLRDGIYVHISQSNVAAHDFLDAIVEAAWG